ncbi:hypothetical protein [Jeongeupia naejangsanensis]|uniref:Uncharacterized protein n=1 Tax=Jeongeupia naejangsanensis TaxID=613195 RepID=A0ABS2BEZ5_9NEIS|nr:hypothetical protein [Jeongeupia naejangsanensis]MBM3114195.1 hypothetical protein [Jeongeupia naejangsanensis]
MLQLAGLDLRASDSAFSEADFGQRLQSKLGLVSATDAKADSIDQASSDWSDRLIFTLMHNVNRQRSNEPAARSRQLLSDTYQNAFFTETQSRHALA